MILPTLDQTRAIREACKETPIFTRRNKEHRDGRQWEVCQHTNDDWRTVTKDIRVADRFGSAEEAGKLCDMLALDWIRRRLVEILVA